MKTYSVKPSDITRSWHVIDASETTLGRVATAAATLLLGKDKPMFSKHIDTGDYVIIINAEKINASGGKLEQKIYYRHSGYPGGLKATTLKDQLAKDPTVILTKAIRGMLPANKLRDDRLKRLKVYSDSEHHHEAQKPKQYSLKEGK